MELNEGVVVDDRYRIDGLLGQGTSSFVYEVFDTKLARKVALKLLLARVSEDLRQRLRREARSAAAVAHKSLVGVYDVGEWKEMLYLTMEHVSDPTLATLLGESRGSLAVDSIWSLGEHIALALTQLHKANIVHRDLKPANIFVVGDLESPGNIRITDFGLAFHLGDKDSMGRLTDPSILGGTPFYMSPEQAAGGEINVSSDIYSLGCILYELIAGVPPFMGEVSDVLSKQLYAQPLELDSLELEREIPHELTEWVHLMLDKRPDKRPRAEDVLLSFGPSTRSKEVRGSGRLKPRSERAVSISRTNEAQLKVCVADATGSVSEIPGLDVLSWSIGDPVPDQCLGVCVPKEMMHMVADLKIPVFVECQSTSRSIAELVRLGVSGIRSGEKGSLDIARVLRRRLKKRSGNVSGRSTT